MIEPTSYQWAILRALQLRQVYAGTANRNAVASRRRRNRLARISRKANRK